MAEMLAESKVEVEKNELPPAKLLRLTRQFLWLKQLRLHKYAPMLLDMSREQLQQLSLEDLQNKGMTVGASKKLLAKFAEENNPWLTQAQLDAGEAGEDAGVVAAVERLEQERATAPTTTTSAAGSEGDEGGEDAHGEMPVEKSNA